MKTLSSDLQANLSPAKRLLLEKRLRGEKIASSIPALVRAPRNAALPLSYAQQRLWFIDQLAPGQAAYNNPGGMRLSGPLNLDILRKSLTEIVRRHEALRTRFVSAKGEPQQVIDEAAALDIPIVELNGTPANEREAAAERWAREEAAKPFDLERGPLIRTGLLRMGDQDHILMLIMHHIISDGWSAEVLVKEFAAVYAALSAGRPSPLPELPVQYADYSVWQRSWLKGAVLEGKLSYWKEQLTGIEPAEMPTDHPRPALQSQSGSTLKFDLERGLADRMREFSRSQGATLYMTLLGALQLLIYRYSGSRDVLIGSPVAGRTQSQVEGLIGLFVNTLVLRTTFADFTFGELLARVKKVTLEAFGHQDVPFEKLVDVLQLERDLSRSPLFQVIFTLQGAAPEFEVGPIKVKPYIVDNGTAKFDLTFLMSESSTSIYCWLEYNNELFDEATAKGIVRHLGAVLEYATANPEAKVDSIPLLNSSERLEILSRSGSNVAAPPHSQGICALVAAQAEERPNSIAVVSDGVRLTYRDLNQAACRLASRIGKLRSGPANGVGILLEQGASQITAALAALRAGVAFVPLNVEEAPERLAYIVADSGIGVIVTDAQSGRLIPAQADLQSLLLDDPAINAGELPDPGPATGLQSVACILYRSGPTGRPEGVAVPERALMGAAFDSVLNYSAEDRVAQSIHFGHDAAGLHVFAVLARGGFVVDLSRKAPLSPREMAKLLRDEKVSAMCASPAVVERLARSAPAALKKLRLILLDDPQALSGPLPQALQGVADRMFAIYGAAELGSWAFAYPTRNGSNSPELAHGTAVYVLDGQFEPASPGVVGEIFVAGADLAEGYHGHPERTAEVFVPDAFSRAPGARLYRTGDLARRRYDGRIQFFGRRDGRLTIAGARIHAKEIVHIARRHDAVADAVVLAAETDAFRDPNLALFAVLAENKTETIEELRRFLSERLPEFMVPARIVVTGAIPLTITGNPDFRLLGQMLSDRKHVAPRNPVEEVLCGIWSKLLNREQVGIHDNFFELGGDSILSVQAIAAAREAGLQITPKQIFEQQTIAQLAEVAGVMASVGAEADADEDGMTGAVPLSPIQKLFFEWDMRRPEHFNQAVLLRLKPGVNPEILEKVWTALLQHHDALRMRFEFSDDGPRQFCEAQIPAGTYRRKDLSDVEPTRQKTELEEDAQRVQAGFDLHAGRLVAAVEYDLGGENGRRLLLAIHHLVIDGVSWRILLQDMERGYEQLAQGGPIRLGAKTSSYKKWTDGIQAYSKSEALLREADYWTRLPNAKPLPCDFQGDRSVNTEETRNTIDVQLEAGETRRLLQNVPGVYRTQINDALLAALGQVCAEWADERQILVDLEGHGREECIAGVDVSGTVGWFTTIYPVSLTINERWEPGTAIKAAKERLRAVPNNGLGYGILRQATGDEERRRRFAASSHSEILFNYIGQVDQLFQASGLFAPADENAGRMSASANRRPYVLEVTGIVAGGRLRISLHYSGRLHRRETIERLARRYLECLREIIEHCRDARAGVYTPSDFPLARLRQKELDTWIGRGEGIEDVYGLSPMQQGMLFHSIYETGSGSGVYFVQIAAELYGGVNAAKFRGAWEAVIRRHPVLRTEFLWEGLQEPVQIVRSNVDIAWHEDDWRGLSDEDQRRKWTDFLKQDRRKGFDLRRVPLLRFALFRTGEDTYYFSWGSHHILMDGWCLSILMGEAITGYAAKLKGQEAEPERPRPYRDYIRWLRQQEEGTAEAFWREELEGFDAPNRLRLEEALSAPLPDEEPYDEATISIGHETTQKLEELARGSRVTLNTVMQGAWAFLLGRYSGDADVIFGAVVAGRSAPVEGIGNMVGLFINTIPARVQLQPEETLAAYLKRLQNKQAKARQFEHCPLIKVQEWSGIQRGKALFESIVIFENFPVDPRLAGSIGTSLKLGAFNFFERTNYPFSLRIIPGKETAVTLIYDRRLFAKQGVDRMLGHLQAVLSGMLLGPEVLVGGLSPLQEQERRQVVLEWNLTAQAYPGDRCIHELFSWQSAKTPDAIALEYKGRRLTYRDLNRKSNQLAHFLRAQGVGPKTLVAVYLERGAEMIAALLGILKAGAAYVPLDMAYPAERLKYMLEDSKPAAVLTHRALLPSLPDFSGLAISAILLDERQPEIDRLSTNDLSPLALPQNLAYVFYTSGSTGTPKGIAGTHRGMVNRMVWMEKLYPIREDDIFCQKTSFGFTDSIAEMFTPLLGGALLKIVPEETARDAGALVDFLRAESVTRIVLVPSLLRVMLEGERANDALGKLRIVVTSGEALSVDLANLAKKAIPHAALLNFYGSTEIAADATWCDLTRRGISDAVSIGKPIANMRAYVLDNDMKPSAIGITGELYIGGPGLARGYLNRGDLTAEKFVPDPFSHIGGERLYRTGDLARWQAEGNLEFVGRKDHQVKVRGQRIELGEVEAALSADPAVTQAVVIAQSDVRETRLIAYITVREKTTSSALRNGLRQRLPEYMAPSAFVILESLPLNTAGKVDRRNLPAPVFGRDGGEESGFAAPSTPVEELLAQIWSEVLGVEKIGVHDDFFNLGGQSLLATQITARVAKVFGVPLRLRHLFTSPTVAALAHVIEQLIKGGKTDGIPPLARVPGESAVALSYAQQRLWFVEQLAPSSAYNIPAAVRIHGPLNVGVLERAVGEVVRRHGSLRTRFVIVNGEARQVVDERETVSMPTIDLASYAEEERELQVRALALEEGRRIFDLSLTPLVRVTLLRLAEQHHVLLATMHHIISDAWSMGILVREISLIYGAFQAGLPSPLPELPIQYTDYSLWQRRWLREELLEQKLDYWRNQLAGLERLDLPADRPRPPVQTPNGVTLEFVLPAETAGKLKGVARREGVTLYMFLLAVFQALLYRYSRQTDVVVGSPIAGRTRKETEGLIGFFVNMLVLRGDLSGNPAFTELLRRIKETTLEAHAHQEAPFERLVEEFEPDRDLSRTPLFQVAFVLQNASQDELVLGETRLEPFNVDNGTAKFDLTLGMTEGASEISAVLQYNTDLFERTTMEGMAHRFRLLFDAITENPEQSVDAIPLITAEERRSLSLQWAGPPLSVQEETICARLRRHAAANQQSLAVLEEGLSLDYGELNRRANQLACVLLQSGVQVGQRVGICLEKGSDWLIACLGVLKAGAAFVPLEPAEPDVRFNHILEDASLRAVVTEEHLWERRRLSKIETILFPVSEKESGEEPGIEVTNDALACILYRSGAGAGGVVDGILIDRRALCAGAGVETTAADRVAQRIDFSREIGFLEVFHTWFVGACVVSIPRTPLPTRQMASLVRDQAATVLWTPYPVLERIASGFSRALKELRFIVCEEPIGDLVQLADGLKPEIKSRLYGLHADTEMAGRGVLYRVEEIEAFQAIPMDRLPRGTTYHLLDPNFAPVPAGLMGEVYVGSEVLSIGYNRLAARNAQVFPPDPFSRVSGGQLYRTGELGRRRNDGRLEMRGRRDGRMVIAGTRIEAREIDAALMRHPDVDQAAVLPRGAGKPQEQGFAAFVAAAGNRITVEELRQFLCEQVPEWVVPTNIHIVDEIPRTAARVNRRLLNEKLQHGEYAAPENRIEEVLCAIWARLLQVEKVGINDNFFRLGGDSILSVQVITHARQAGIQITPRQMFERQTIAELAKVAVVLQETEVEAEKLDVGTGPPLSSNRDERRNGDGYSPSDFPLSGLDQEELERVIEKGSDVEDIYSLTPMQAGMLFHAVSEGAGAVYFTHMSCRLQGAVDQAAFRQAWEDVVRRHDILRTSFRWEGLKAPVQIVHRNAALRWREEDWRGLGKEDQEQKWREFLERDIRQGLNYRQAPLMRVGLFRTAEESWYFVWGFGHILMDGWCLPIVMSEVFALYEAHRTGEKPPLSPPTPFRNYIAWLRGQDEGKAEAFWRSELEGFRTATRLRIERERRPGENGHGDHRQIRFVLEREMTAKLEELARAHRVTLNAVVQGAWGILLSRYSGERDVVFGATVAGRSVGVPDIERMVGLFINTLPVRVRAADELTVPEYLKALQLTQVEARDVEYAPLVKVQSWSDIAPGSSLFESLVVFENLPVDTALQQQLAKQIVIGDVQLVSLSNYPLALRITPAKELVFDLIYRTQTYDDKSAERMVGHLRAVLEQMAAQPNGEIGKISLLAKDEYQNLVDDWNQDDSEFLES
jgi:amino acid adenylation domain-containing protein/non-ribosomal peptide synthase protein (TIGR01720 family)